MLERLVEGVCRGGSPHLSVLRACVNERESFECALTLLDHVVMRLNLLSQHASFQSLSLLINMLVCSIIVFPVPVFQHHNTGVESFSLVFCYFCLSCFKVTDV